MCSALCLRVVALCTLRLPINQKLAALPIILKTGMKETTCCSYVCKSCTSVLLLSLIFFFFYVEQTFLLFLISEEWQKSFHTFKTCREAGRRLENPPCADFQLTWLFKALQLCECYCKQMWERNGTKKVIKVSKPGKYIEWVGLY